MSCFPLEKYFEIVKNAAGYHLGPVAPSTADRDGRTHSVYKVPSFRVTFSDVEIAK